MNEVATALLFDANNELLIYRRDNKPTIPFPNFWDLFGGHIEDGETPEEALLREIREELGITVDDYELFKVYHCDKGDVAPNIKHVFWVKTHQKSQDLTLYEGQYHSSIKLDDAPSYEFANILGTIIQDFSASAFGKAKNLVFEKEK